MTTATNDMKVLRELAGRYSELAHLDVQRKRLDRYARSNDLEIVRPVMLIDEVPWGEIGRDSRSGARRGLRARSARAGTALRRLRLRQSARDNRLHVRPTK